MLDEFYARVAQTVALGKITTWVRTDDGKFFTHKSVDWRGKAWFRSEVKANELVFNIVPSKDKTVSITAYGYYHGHLIETFLNHFDDLFSTANASARPNDGDRVA